ncbi:hypothetical protein Q1695_011091 [Nippostrongylus brasiliensis]|nr:hypothetical protein Q1695_011091 [Nippostrongylus brasiliensis]
MLSAAQDILNKHKGMDPIEDNVTDSRCVPEITHRICSPTSTGVVLLCNIMPGLCVKVLCPLIKLNGGPPRGNQPYHSIEQIVLCKGIAASAATTIPRVSARETVDRANSRIETST